MAYDTSSYLIGFGHGQAELRGGLDPLDQRDPHEWRVQTSDWQRGYQDAWKGLEPQAAR